jgi:hypothetical protein
VVGPASTTTSPRQASAETSLSTNWRSLTRSAARPGRVLQNARDRDHVAVDAPLQVQPPEADAARLDQDADRVGQPVDVAPGVRLRAAHRDLLVGDVGRRRVVPLGRQPGVAQLRDRGPAKPLLGRLRHELRQVGGRRVLQQRIEALHGAELLEIAADHGVLVRVDRHDRGVLAHQQRLGLRLRRLQQQVVAVRIDAVRGGAPVRLGAVRIGAREHDDVDAIEQRRQAALGQLLRDHEQRLAAGRLVAVLLADQQHGRPAADQAGRRACGRRHLGAGEQQRLERRAVLRRTQREQAHVGTAGALRTGRREAIQDRAQLRIGREAAAAGLECRRAVDNVGVGEARADGRPVRGCLGPGRLVERRRRRQLRRRDRCGLRDRRHRDAGLHRRRRRRRSDRHRARGARRRLERHAGASRQRRQREPQRPGPGARPQVVRQHRQGFR